MSGELVLSDEEKRRACEWIAQAGAHFVKTLHPRTPTRGDPGGRAVDVRSGERPVSGEGRGGVRELPELLEYLRAGARRFWLDPDRRFSPRVPGITSGAETQLCGLRDRPGGESMISSAAS